MSMYGVYGKNGGGIYTDWCLVLQSKKYIKGFKGKKFKNVNEAASFVVSGLEEDYGVVSVGEVPLDSLKKYNWFYRLEELRFGEDVS